MMDWSIAFGPVGRQSKTPHVQELKRGAGSHSPFQRSAPSPENSPRVHLFFFFFFVVLGFEPRPLTLANLPLANPVLCWVLLR
jgi:hypothetical protein